MKQLADPEDAFYLMPPFLSLNPIEREFINSWIPEERLFVLPAETIPGITPSSDTSVMLWPDRLVDIQEDGDSTGATDVEQLSWILQPENAPAAQDDGTLTLFHAYGVTNEAREVLRRITAMQVPVDTVTVAYTGSEYVQVFHSLCKRAGIPLTVSEGIPASLTRPGKALKGIIEWIRSDFNATVLRQLLIEGSIDLPPDEGDLFLLLVKKMNLYPDKGDGVLPPLETAELLRTSGIGWGMARYASILAAYRTRTGNELAGMDKNNPKYALLLNSMELAKQLADAMERILAQVPEPDASGSVIFSNLLLGIWLILDRLARVGDKMDQQALDAISTYLSDFHNLTRLSLGFEDALDRLADAADNLRVGTSSPKPGALHLVSYRNLHWTGRPNTFVVGLDADSFPGGVSQDPVLLDSERQRLHPELSLGRDRPRVRQYEMLTALSSRRGRVTLSFPSYNVVENRDNLPSSLLLQAFPSHEKRLVPGLQQTAALAGQPSRVLPGRPRTSHRRYRVVDGQFLVKHLANGPVLVTQCYRNVERGQAALSARQVGAPTEYDGLVAAAGEDMTRRRDHLTLSCSRIEHLARCPFAYFLKYVLHLEPPEEVAYDPGRWLDPMERGLLLHELYCQFMKEIVRKKQRVCAASHKNMMYEMADELIARYRMDTPLPSEVVLNREVKGILDSCNVFLAIEESEIESTPVFFEVPFGMPEEKPGSDMGTADPVMIDLGHGVSFPLRGQIDRIDEMGKDIYCIWDYKTGSARGYEDQKYLYKGRQVQHALYAIAAEKILRDRLGGDPRVLSSGYYFPTKRGEGRLVVRPESERSLITGLMGTIFDILSSGVFLAPQPDLAAVRRDLYDLLDWVEYVIPEMVPERGWDGLQELLLTAFRRRKQLNLDDDIILLRLLSDIDRSGGITQHFCSVIYGSLFMKEEVLHIDYQKRCFTQWTHSLIV